MPSLVATPRPALPGIRDEAPPRPGLRQRLRKPLIRFGLEAIYFTGAHRLLRPLFGGQGAILTLHHVRPARPDAFQPNGLLEITPDFLDDLVGSLRRDGYDIVTLDEVHRRLTGRASGKPFVAITFDDGYRDNRDHALPVLARHEAPFAVYIPTRFPDGTGVLWWVALERAIARNEAVEICFDTPKTLPTRTLAERRAAYDTIYWALRGLPDHQRLVRATMDICSRNGVDLGAICRELCMDWAELAAFAQHPLVTIGAHTVNHLMLGKERPEIARREMADSIAILTEKLGRRPQHFSYPIGDPGAAGEREFRIARELGLKTAVTTRPDVLSARHREHLTGLPRISVNGEFQRLRYMRALLSGVPTGVMARVGLAP